VSAPVILFVRATVPSGGGLVVEQLDVVDAPSHDAAVSVAQQFRALLGRRRKGQYARRLRTNVKPAPRERALPRLEPSA
jgi:hypothetical protein